LSNCKDAKQYTQSEKSSFHFPHLPAASRYEHRTRINLVEKEVGRKLLE